VPSFVLSTITPADASSPRGVSAASGAFRRWAKDEGLLLVPPEDATALRAAIDRVLGDPELARSLGAAARARVESSHTSRGFAARLAPLLRSVVAGG